VSETPAKAGFQIQRGILIVPGALRFVNERPGIRREFGGQDGEGGDA
jgi:hypothetical protein